jgi:hypothetical protein
MCPSRLVSAAGSPTQHRRPLTAGTVRAAALSHHRHTRCTHPHKRKYKIDTLNSTAPDDMPTNQLPHGWTCHPRTRVACTHMQWCRRKRMSTRQLHVLLRPHALTCNVLLLISPLQLVCIHTTHRDAVTIACLSTQIHHTQRRVTDDMAHPASATWLDLSSRTSNCLHQTHHTP